MTLCSPYQEVLGTDLLDAWMDKYGLFISTTIGS